jgi:hypothetical protein
MPFRRLGLRCAVTSVIAVASIGLLTGASYSVASAQVDDRPATSYARETLAPSTEVWQVAERPYDENRSNPLAGRVWGVYQGPQDQTSDPFLSSHGNKYELLAKIGLRPKTKWYGTFVPDNGIRATVQSHIASAQAGDPDKLVQIAVFRMTPWEQEGCERRSTPKEKRSYKRWINELAAGIADTPMLVVMQPDGPFLWCTPDKAAKSRLLTYATKKLSSLPRTSVYIDAGAADWCENGRGNDPGRCAQLLMRTGIEYARGFALDSTHYTGPAENIAHGSKIVAALQGAGYGKKHFIIDTAKSGRPTMWDDVIPEHKLDLKDNARVCRTSTQIRCVTLGIPPTVRTADPKWELSADVRALARRYVDGFVWFGRPWLHNQADPFVMKRAITMARSTPWPGPLLSP